MEQNHHFDEIEKLEMDPVLESKLTYISHTDDLHRLGFLPKEENPPVDFYAERLGEGEEMTFPIWSDGVYRIYVHHPESGFNRCSYEGRVMPKKEKKEAATPSPHHVCVTFTLDETYQFSVRLIASPHDTEEAIIRHAKTALEVDMGIHVDKLRHSLGKNIFSKEWVTVSKQEEKVSRTDT